jgi:hypothetical protein
MKAITRVFKKRYTAKIGIIFKRLRGKELLIFKQEKTRQKILPG